MTAKIKWPKLDALFADDDAWESTVRAVQSEIWLAQAPDVRWDCPDDIAEDIICAVAARLEAHGDAW